MGALQTSIIIIGAVKSLWNNNGTGGRENRNKKAINPIHLELSYNNHLPFQKKEKKTPKEQHSYISLPVHRARSLSPLVVMRYITKHRRQPQDTKKNGSLSSLVSVRREKKKRKKRKKNSELSSERLAVSRENISAQQVSVRRGRGVRQS